MSLQYWSNLVLTIDYLIVMFIYGNNLFILGDRPSFILPDRFKYVNIDTPFIKSYFLAVIKTCHKRGAPATGGMVGLTIKPGCSSDCEEYVFSLISHFS